MALPKNYQKYIGLIFITLLLLLVYLIVKPFLILLLSGAVLAYIFYPIYKITKKTLKRETISALIVSIIILILIVIPSIFVVVSIGEQAETFYQTVKVSFNEDNNIFNCNNSESNFCSIFSYLDEPNISQYFNPNEILGKISSSVVSWVTNFLLSIPKLLLDFIVIIFIMFYFFKDGERFIEYIKNNIKIKKANMNVIIKKIRNVIDSILFGNIIMAIVQGTLGSLGFWALGVNSPLLWGILMAFFSLVPFVGTAAIWLPASLILIFTGNWIKGLILIIYGFLIIGGVDTLVKPILIGDKAQIHPIIILLGVLGGIPLFGMMGIILGPLILGIVSTLFTTFVSDRK